MSRKSFAALLEKYQEGKCTDEEKKLVEYWFALLENDAAEQVSDQQLDGAEDRMWAKLQQETGLDNPDENAQTPIRYHVFKWFGIAASLLLVAWFITSKMRSTEPQLASSGWIEKRNESNLPVLVRLEDSSSVTLSPKSSLRYPARFAKDERVVILKGKGFFDIQKNPAKPFYVHSGEMVTRVLGTSFYVDNQKQKGKTSIEVITGLVQVYANSEKNTKVSNKLLRPNHTATFDPESQTFALGIAGQPRLLDEAVSFQFRNAQLSEVSSNLTKAWGIRVEAANRQILTCPITANLSDQPLFTQLDIICAALNARYIIRGNTIFISGPGCNTLNKKTLNQPDMDS